MYRLLAIKRWRSRLIVAAMMCFQCCLLQGKAMTDGINDFYDRWDLLSTKELSDKALTFIDKEDKTDSATVCFTIITNRYNKGQISDGEMDLCISAFVRLGYLYQYHYYDYSKAYTYLQQALSLSEKTGISSSLPSIYLNLGTLYFSNYISQKDHRRAYGTMSYLKKSFYAAQKVGQYDCMQRAITDLLNLVLFYGDVKDISHEIAVFKRQQFPKSLPNTEFTRLFCDAVLAKSRGDIDGALALLDKMATLVEKNNVNSRLLLIVYTSKATILDAAERYDEALQCAQEELSVAERYKVKDVLSNAYGSMADVYQKLGNKEKSEYYELLYYRQKDALMQDSRLNKVDEYGFLYRLKEVNDRVAQVEQQRRQQQTVLWAVAIVAIAVTVCLIFVVRLYRRLRENHRRLYEKNLELLQKEAEERKAREHNSNLVPSEKADIQPQSTAETAKYASSYMDETERQQLRDRVRTAMESSSEIYKDDFSIGRLAELLHVHQRYISQVLNEQDGQNFKTMLNDYRIKEACRRMSGSSEYANYSIEAIAESVGFKSRTYFSSLFKRITGLAPSDYLREAMADKR